MVQQMNDKIAFLNRYTLSSKNKVEEYLEQFYAEWNAKK